MTNEVLLSDAICSDIEKEICRDLDRIGMYYRIFGRVKSPQSLAKKLELKHEKYLATGAKLQDIIGIRIVVYFEDDVEICRQVLKRKHVLDNEEYDEPNKTEFKPTRVNLVFRIPADVVAAHAFEQAIGDNPIDSTFEVQIRTVFSEGWHEVEHDLRYKRQNDWKGHETHERTLNGIFATLITCDWAIIKLFDDLAYDHYLSQKWLPMCLNHFRVRLPIENPKSIESLFAQCTNLGKEVFKFDRKNLIALFLDKYYKIPVTLLHILYVINQETIRDASLMDQTPDLIKECGIEKVVE